MPVSRVYDGKKILNEHHAQNQLGDVIKREDPMYNNYIRTTTSK